MKLLINIIAFVAGLFFMGMLISFPIMWLWNWLIPPLLGLSTITVFEAFGLYLLLGILFKNV